MLSVFVIWAKVIPSAPISTPSVFVTKSLSFSILLMKSMNE